MKSTAIALLLLCLFSACNNQNSGDSADTDTTTTIHPPMDSTVTDAGSSLGNYPTPEPGIGAYDTIAAGFKGNPDAKNVKQLMDTVLRQCNMEVSHDNVMRFANALEVRRKNSKAGVTEMDLLKEMHQHGTATDLDKRLETATTVLEKTK